MHKSSFNNGLFLGTALIISTYAIYWANPALFFTAKSSILLIIYFLIILKTGSEVKRSQDGYLTYGQGFKNMFVTGAIAVFMCTIFEYILFNFIGPELAEMKKELELESMENLRGLVLELSPNYETQFDDALEQLENTDTSGIYNTFKTFINRLFAPAALSAAIMSLVIMRKPPVDGANKTKDPEQKKYIINK